MAASRSESRPLWTLAAVCVPLFAVCVNTTSINTALPAIAQDFHSTQAGLQWVVNAYVLAAAAFVVTCGDLGDIYGRRRVFVYGIVVYALASLVIAASTGPAMLIAGRALQGLGSAVIVPVSLSIIGVSFAPERRAGAIGIWAAIVGLGFALGPLIGGFLTDALSWQWVFWLNLPVSAAAIVFVFARVAESRDEARKLSIDVPGVVLLGLGAFALVLALNEGRGSGWTSPFVLGLFGAAAVLLVTFRLIEPRRPSPLVTFAFFGRPAFLAANLGTFVVTFVLFAVFYVYNLYLQNDLLFDYSAVKSGAALLPLSMALFAVSLVVGRLVLRFGVRGPVTVGFLAMALGLYLVSMVDVGSTYADLWPGFLIAGVGTGLVNGPTSAAAVSAVPEDRAGEASGVVNMARYLGGAFGVAVTAVVYGGVGVSKLNDHLGADRVTAAQERQLDQLLSGDPTGLNHALAGFSPAQAADFKAAAKLSVVDAFAAANRVMIVAALIGAVSAAVLLRVRHPAHHQLWHRAAAPSTIHTVAPGPEPAGVRSP
ncbi:MAG TPA: MFS transporter [Solirubrobacteraceae bacterium]|nr:MFS transporter [Solirubrobacteraceae bacterium]